MRVLIPAPPEDSGAGSESMERHFLKRWGEALQPAKTPCAKAWERETKRLTGEMVSNLKQLCRALEEGVMGSEKEGRKGRNSFLTNVCSLCL